MVPMCEWCGEHEVGSISGGSDRFCSTDCLNCAEQCAAEWEALEVDFYDPFCGIDPFNPDDGRWDDDPNPYHGDFSEE